MKTLNSTVAILALMAGTALTPISAYAQDQLGSGMDQSQGVDQGTDQGDELLLKNQQQNESTQSEGTTMPEAQQQDQAESNEVQDPSGQTQDQATEDELLKQQNRTEDQAQSPQQDEQSEEQATDEDQLKRKNQTEDQAQSPSGDQQDQTTADRERRKERNADQDTATDSRRKTDDATASEKNMKTDENKDQASSSQKPSNETTGSINISAEQKTVIKSTIVEANVKPVNIDFKVSVGVSVPKTIELHPLPPKVVEIMPAYRDYVYFILADGRIVIVQPDTYEVVYILVV